jgi:hypothetical protein
LAVARNIRKLVILTGTRGLVNLAQLDMFIAVEPYTQLSGRHIEVKLELRNTILSIPLLTFHNQIKVVLGSAGSFEGSDVDRVGFRLVGRSLPYSVLRTRLKVAFRITVILYEPLCEDLNGFNFLWAGLDCNAADVISDKTGFQRLLNTPPCVSTLAPTGFMFTVGLRDEWRLGSREVRGES